MTEFGSGKAEFGMIKHRQKAWGRARVAPIALKRLIFQ
jgi:hypothetical protein